MTKFEKHFLDCSVCQQSDGLCKEGAKLLANEMDEHAPSAVDTKEKNKNEHVKD